MNRTSTKFTVKKYISGKNIHKKNVFTYRPSSCPGETIRKCITDVYLRLFASVRLYARVFAYSMDIGNVVRRGGLYAVLFSCMFR